MEERDQGVCPNCLSRSFLPIELLLLHVSCPEVTPAWPPFVMNTIWLQHVHVMTTLSAAHGCHTFLQPVHFLWWARSHMWNLAMRMSGRKVTSDASPADPFRLKTSCVFTSLSWQHVSLDWILCLSASLSRATMDYLSRWKRRSSFSDRWCQWS